MGWPRCERARASWFRTFHNQSVAPAWTAMCLCMPGGGKRGGRCIHGGGRMRARTMSGGGWIRERRTSRSSREHALRRDAVQSDGTRSAQIAWDGVLRGTGSRRARAGDMPAAHPGCGRLDDYIGARLSVSFGHSPTVTPLSPNHAHPLPPSRPHNAPRSPCTSTNTSTSASTSTLTSSFTRSRRLKPPLPRVVHQPSSHHSLPILTVSAFFPQSRPLTLPAYFVAFGPHGPRAPLNAPGNGMRVFGGVAAAVAAAFGIFTFARSQGE
jgi:hypothetical protein